ncbi:MAG: hypothetical protein HY376_02640 [Candidatus Blackburnbacteria bacterium]|nr:hypothetical protein [Candidatus Blackburnbacteria bacterium]
MAFKQDELDQLQGLFDKQKEAILGEVSVMIDEQLERQLKQQRKDIQLVSKLKG